MEGPTGNAEPRDGWWSEFSQKEELTTRLRNILREYPEGIGPFKEFLQNADDASARDFGLILDNSDPLRPALLVYNDGVFSDRDFESITSLGRSGKAQDSTKIGKFGLGFNVAYHFADTVSFISERSLVLFDPHGRQLPKQALGLRTDFVAHPETFSELEHHAVPICTVADRLGRGGAVRTEGFDGTLFRLSLRTAAEAKASLVSNAVYTADTVLEAFAGFAEVASSCLLFLKHIERVRIFVIGAGDHVDGGSADLPLDPVFSIEVVDPTDESRDNRAATDGFFAGAAVASDPTAELVRAFELGVRVTKPFLLAGQLPPPPLVVPLERWLVQTSGRLIPKSSPFALHAKQEFEWASVATRIDSAAPTDTAGRAYCFLPLPVVTGQPLVHINAPFALSSNRRDLWREEEADSMLRAQWNAHLLTGIVPECYTRMLVRLTDLVSAGDQDAIYRRWPSATAAAPFDALGTTAQQLLVNSPVWWDPARARWRAPSNFHVDSGLFATCCGDPETRQVLGEKGLLVVNPPPTVQTSLTAAGVLPPTVSAFAVARALKKTGKNETAATVPREAAGHLLRYFAESIAEDPANKKHIDGLELLPLHNTAILGKLYLQGGKPTAATGSKHRKKDKPNAKKRGADATPPRYFLCDTDFRGMFFDFSRFVDASGDLAAVLESESFAGTNVARLTPTDAASLMHHLLPAATRGRRCIAFKEPTGGCSIDVAAAAAPSAEVQGQQGVAKSGLKSKVAKGKGKGGRRQAAVPANAGVGAGTSDGDGAASKVPMDARSVSARLQALWGFINGAQQETSELLHRLFSEWPIIETVQGYLLSEAQAKQRAVLKSTAGVDDVQRELLRRTGVLFIAPGIECAAARSAIAAGSTTVLQAVVASASASESTGREFGIALRGLVVDELVESAAARSVTPAALKTLPMFETISGSFGRVVSTTGVRLLHLPPGGGQAAQALAGQVALHFSARLLADDNEAALQLLEQVGLARPMMTDFLVDFLLPTFLRGDVSASQELSLAFLEAVGSTALWKGGRDGKATAEMITSLSDVGLVVLDDGTCMAPEALADPDDDLMREIFQQPANTAVGSGEGSVAETGHAETYPPKAYQDSPSIMHSLRAIGLRNMKHPGVFVKAARIVAGKSDRKNGARMLPFLKSEHTRWPEAVIKDVSRIRWVPLICCGRNAPAPVKVVPLPVEDSAAALAGHPNRKAEPKEGAKTKAQNVNSFMRLAEEELQAALDTHELNGDDGMFCNFELQKRAISLMRTAPEDLLMRPTSSDATVQMGCLAHAMPMLLAWQCWTQALLLPMTLRNMDARFMSRCQIPTQVTFQMLAEHLQALARTWTLDNDDVSPPPLDPLVISHRQGVVLSCCAMLFGIVKGHSGPGRSMVCNLLGGVRFIVLDSGGMIAPDAICTDLDSDAGIVRAVPDYMYELSDFLQMLGSRSADAITAPPVRIKASEPAPALAGMISSQFNQAVFADVEFRVDDGSDEVVFAHKMVLGMASEVFKTMFFTGSLKESTEPVSELLVPEWITRTTLLWMLRYIYQGIEVSCAEVGPMHPVSSARVSETLNLLAAADLYGLSHLKQWCEQYLADDDVLVLQNLFLMVGHADQYHATQLRRACIFKLRMMVDVAAEMPEWHALSEGIKAEILPKSLSKKLGLSRV